METNAPNLSVSIINCARHVARLESKLDTLFLDSSEKDSESSPFSFDSTLIIFSQHVEYLAKEFESIQASVEKNVDSSLLSFVHSLSLRIQALQAAIPKSIPQPSSKPKSRVHASNHPDPLGQIQREIKASRAQEKQYKRELLKPLSVTSTSRSTLVSNPSKEPQTLDYHATLQAKLAADLASMASQLKANSKAFSEHLQIDAKAIHHAATALSQNQTRMSATTQRLKQYSMSSRSTVLTLFLVILFMCLISVAMYMVIRVF